MKREDLDKIITAAVNVANENASVYGSQIRKDHKDKTIFRPDSYIKLAAGGSFGGGGAFGSGGSSSGGSATGSGSAGGTSSGSGSAGGSSTSSGSGAAGGSPGGSPPAASTPGASATPSGSAPLFQKLKMTWRHPDRSDVMFEEFFKAVFEAYGADNLKSIGYYKLDDTEGKPIPLEQNDLWGFASKLEPKLRNIKYTVEFGVATVGQGERGGEKILSLYDLISPKSYIDFTMFPLYKDKTVQALLQINAQIRNEITKKNSTPSMMENLREFDKNSGWWNTVKDSLQGIKESLITRN
jgi:hypothetical protein